MNKLAILSHFNSIDNTMNYIIFGMWYIVYRYYWYSYNYYLKLIKLYNVLYTYKDHLSSLHNHYSILVRLYTLFCTHIKVSYITVALYLKKFSYYIELLIYIHIVVKSIDFIYLVIPKIHYPITITVTDISVIITSSKLDLVISLHGVYINSITVTPNVTSLTNI